MQPSRAKIYIDLLMIQDYKYNEGARSHHRSSDAPNLVRTLRSGSSSSAGRRPMKVATVAMAAVAAALSRVEDEDEDGNGADATGAHGASSSSDALPCLLGQSHLT